MEYIFAELYEESFIAVNNLLYEYVNNIWCYKYILC